MATTIFCCSGDNGGYHSGYDSCYNCEYTTVVTTPHFSHDYDDSGHVASASPSLLHLGPAAAAEAADMMDEPRVEMLSCFHFTEWGLFSLPIKLLGVMSRVVFYRGTIFLAPVTQKDLNV